MLRKDRKKEFSDQSTVNIQFTQLYGKGENELSTTKYVEGENLISGEVESQIHSEYGCQQQPDI